MAKGGQFERDIAKILTKWVTGQERPYVFWRTPASGALMTVANAVDVSGDIMAIRPEGRFLTAKFSFECKNGYPKANFHKHLKKIKNNEIEGFWEECIGDARKAGKHGILIWRKLGFPKIIGFELMDANFLRGAFDRAYRIDLPTKTVTLGFETLPDLQFFDFIEFFNIVPVDEFKKVIKKLKPTRAIVDEDKH